jgi:hypothetical protein
MRSPATAPMTGLAVAVLLTATAARADGWKAPSVHVGFAVGKAQVSAVPSDLYSDALLGVSIGYTVDRSLAFELFDQRFVAGPLGAALSNAVRAAFGAKAGPSEVPERHVGVAAIGALPLADAWRVLGRLGLGSTRVAVYGPPKGDFLRTENRTDPSVGAGLAFDASARWTFSLNAARFTKTKTTATTLGAQFRF